ncbi:MAG: hypothetical protein NG712_05480, partial [Omnitrophica bacterium]|nr:hypothetical protein [Candidatus Omnitrophota bacterium]
MGKSLIFVVKSATLLGLRLGYVVGHLCLEEERRGTIIRRKHIIFYALILVFSTVVLGAPELLLNPSFEEGSMKNPWEEWHGLNSWSDWGSGGWAAWKYSAVSGIAAHTGTKYLVAGAN